MTILEPKQEKNIIENYNKNSLIYSSIPLQRHIKCKNLTTFMAEPQKKTEKPSEYCW